MNKKVGLILLGIVFSLVLVSSQIEINNQGTSTQKEINLITPTPPSNNTIGTVNSSSYWGTYLYTDYNMPTIKLFGYNQTQGAINYCVANASATYVKKAGDVMTGQLRITNNSASAFLVQTEDPSDILLVNTLIPQISAYANIVVDADVSAINYYGNGEFLDNICLSNGTGCSNANSILNNTKAGYNISAEKLHTGFIDATKTNLTINVSGSLNNVEIRFETYDVGGQSYPALRTLSGAGLTNDAMILGSFVYAKQFENNPSLIVQCNPEDSQSGEITQECESNITVVGSSGRLKLNGGTEVYTENEMMMYNNARVNQDNVTQEGLYLNGRYTATVSTRRGGFIGWGHDNRVLGYLYMGNNGTLTGEATKQSSLSDLGLWGIGIADGISYFSNLNVTQNVHIDGNLSVKRPYWNGYDNSTQAFLNTANVQVINISNNADYDSYGIHVVGSQNLTFDHTGDYQCTLSPEFFQNGGGSLVTFWFQKNGVDVAWSNSRYSMSNNEYNAPSIIYQFDIETPATDDIRFMWWSDSTSTQIYSSGPLTSPTRPSIPGVLLTCLKVSEIT